MIRAALLAFVFFVSTVVAVGDDKGLAGGHPYFWEPLPICKFKASLANDLEKTRHMASASFRDTLKGQVLVVYSHSEDRTWFLVVNYLDRPHGCIVQRGDKYNLYFGKPT